MSSWGKFGNWTGMVSALEQAQYTIDREARREFGQVAQKVATSMVTGITTKRFNLAPNAPSTVKAKKSSTPLIDDGDLVGSIKSHELPREGYLVGTHRTEVDQDGNNVANIFETLTVGVDRITSTGKRVSVPARDAITPAMEENKQAFEEAGARVVMSPFKTVF